MDSPRTNEVADDALWCVKLPNGDLSAMTLDALDRAFEAGEIDAGTLLLAEGATAWVTLGQVAGLDAEAADAPTVTSVAPPSHDGPLAAPPGSSSGPPFAAERDDLELADPFGAKRRGRVVMLAGAVVALGAGLALVFSMSGAPPPAADVGATVATEPVRASAGGNVDAPDTRLTDEQRRTLLENDRGREAQRKSRAPAAGRARSNRPGQTPFHQGGDPHDPLNAKL